MKAKKSVKPNVLSAVVSADQAAQLLGVSVSTIWRLIKNGEIASFKIGRSRRIPRLQILELLACGNHQPDQLEHKFLLVDPGNDEIHVEQTIETARQALQELGGAAFLTTTTLHIAQERAEARRK